MNLLLYKRHSVFNPLKCLLHETMATRTVEKLEFSQKIFQTQKIKQTDQNFNFY